MTCQRLESPPLTFPGPTALATWTSPEGSFFLWVTFNNAIDTSKPFEVAGAKA